jgi:cytochrome c-type biogenesis protein CcmF
VTVLLVAPDINLLPKVGLFLAGAIGLASLAPLWKRNLRRTPLFTYGMVVAHLGVAVALGGMASEAAFTKETLVAAKVGERHAVGPFLVTLKSIDPVAGPNWTALDATMNVERGNKIPYTMHPQARMFADPPTETSESALSTHWDGQLYLVLGKQDEQGRWQVRMWWKPFVTLIWFGGILIALGGALSLVGHLRREALARKRKEWA